MSDVFSDRGPEPRGLSTQIFKRISWGAIFSGVLVALGLEILFLLFGLFIGFRLSGGGLKFWSWIWYFVTSFFSLYVGGWVASRLAGNPNRANGMLHGFVTWGLTTVATFAILTGITFRTVSESTALLQTAAMTTQVVPMTPAERAQTREQAADVTSRVPQPAQPRSLAHAVSNLSLMLWIGLLIGIAGSVMGGARAVTRSTEFTAPTP